MINKIYKIIFVDVRKNGHKGVRCLQRMTNNAVGNKRGNLYKYILSSFTTLFQINILLFKNILHKEYW